MQPSQVAAAKEEALGLVGAGGEAPALPEGAAGKFRDARAREFETGRLHCEVEWAAPSGGHGAQGAGGAATTWRMRMQARRKFTWQSWTLTFVEVAAAEPAGLAAAAGLAPQTRQWRAESQSLQWRVLFRQGVPYSPGRDVALGR